MKMTLHGTNNTPNVFTTNSIADKRLMTSRNDLQWWSKGDKVSISTSDSLFSDSLLCTSWSTVRIDNLMDPVVGFTMARKTAWQTLNEWGYVSFTEIMFSENSELLPSPGYFVVPVQGIYFISCSIAMDSADVFSYIYTHIAVVNLGPNFNERAAATVHADVIGVKLMSTNSVLLALNAGDTVGLKFSSWDSNSHYSDEHYQTALSGFLYEPISGVKVAWSVGHRGDNCLNGPISAVPFNEVWLNEGSAWNSSSSSVVISHDGVYWLNVYGAANCFEIHPLNMIVNLNGQPLFNVMQADRTDYMYDSRSHSIIYRLKKFDSLTVSMPVGSGTFISTMEPFAGFSGFLIYPE